VIVVDASVLIAFLDAADQHHTAAVELVAGAVPPLIVHPMTLAEVLVAPVRLGIADAVWADLVAVGVEVDTTPIDSVELARLRVETGCKLPDCCVLACAAGRGVGVATFDDRLRRHAGPSA
jgi:predicted nucleic acid-binding protein